MDNINSVSESYMCSNCGACLAICPHNAITFEKSVIGRHYAKTNDHCTNCGLCRGVCPSLGLAENGEDPFIGYVEKVYVGKSSDEEIYKNSQSGGMATAILNYLFDISAIDAAIVTVMSEGPNPYVEGKIVTISGELYKSQKSCYTPVELLPLLKKTSHYQSVAIVGLPCHIDGLRNLQNKSKRFANVKYAIGLICDRTLCEGIQDVITSFCNEPILKIDWRRKDFSYKRKYYSYSYAPIVAYNSSGYMNVFPKYYRTALKDMFTSPRCRVCPNKLNTHADIVLGDPWGMKGVDLKHGQSLVLTRTQEGDSVTHSMLKEGMVVLQERTLDEVLKGQHIENRRYQVSSFSAALGLKVSKDSEYAYMKIDEDSIEKSYQSFKYFVDIEKKRKEEIVKLSKEIIKKEERERRFRNNYVYRIIKKLMSLLKITNK